MNIIKKKSMVIMSFCSTLVLCLIAASVCLSEEPVGNHLNETKSKVVFVDIVKLVKSMRPDITLEQPCFHLDLEERGHGIVSTICRFALDSFISIRVCKDEEVVEDIFYNLVYRCCSMPSGLDDEKEKIGDMSYSYRGNEYVENGPIRFRLKNVVVEIRGDTTKATENMAANVERSILQGANGISLGTEIVAPEIAEVNIPEKVKFGERITTDIIIKNVDPEKVLISASTSMASGVLVARGKRPTMVYFAPIDGSAVDSLTIYTSYGGVVSSKKEIVVKITDVPEELVKKRSKILEK